MCLICHSFQNYLWLWLQKFRPLLWASAPLTFSLVHLPPPLPPPFPEWISTGVCIHTVCNRGGGDGVIGGLRQRNTCRQVPGTFTGQGKPTFWVWCLYRYLVHVWTVLLLQGHSEEVQQHFATVPCAHQPLLPCCSDAGTNFIKRNSTKGTFVTRAA